ncbi:MAG: hypothetical protein JXR31_05620 [Prolixibacteraceae bacterium]|nr:hypothetical protein [Prolixibacteraceae bacterium]
MPAPLFPGGMASLYAARHFSAGNQKLPARRIFFGQFPDPADLFLSENAKAGTLAHLQSGDCNPVYEHCKTHQENTFHTS